MNREEYINELRTDLLALVEEYLTPVALRTEHPARQTAFRNARLARNATREGRTTFRFALPKRW